MSLINAQRRVLQTVRIQNNVFQNAFVNQWIVFRTFFHTKSIVQPLRWIWEIPLKNHVVENLDNPDAEYYISSYLSPTPLWTPKVGRRGKTAFMISQEDGSHDNKHVLVCCLKVRVIKVYGREYMLSKSLAYTYQHNFKQFCL